jgi:hypothetical protein
MKNHHQFSKSQQVAISFLSNFTEATSSWKNFIWFHRISMSDIDKIRESSSGGSRFKKIKRTFFFYGYRETLIAKVILEGNQFTNTDESKPTFWKVIEVHYVNNYDGSKILFARTWIKVQVNKKDQVLI